MQKLYCDSITYYINAPYVASEYSRILFFIHGFGGNVNSWVQLMQSLDTRIYPVFIELPGHGEAPKTMEANLNEILMDIHHIKANLIGSELKIDIVAHSLGGSIARCYLSEYQNDVDKLILISSALTLNLHPSMLEQIENNTLDKKFVFDGLGNLSEKQKEQIFIDLSMIKRLSKNSYIFDEKILKSSTSEIFHLPTMIMYGDQDKIISPRKTRALSNIFPNNSIVEINDCYHYAHLERSQLVTSLINRFLIPGSNQNKAENNSLTFTVTYDGKFWIGIFEQTHDGNYSVARTIFGGEPTDPEIYQYILKTFLCELKFTTPKRDLEINYKKINPKRRMREVKREKNSGSNVSKAQDALRVELEKNKKERKTTNKLRREEEAKQKFLLKQQQKKSKLRGH